MRKKENANPGMPIQKSDKIFVAGHRGMVGSALTRALEASGYTNLIKRDRRELYLCDVDEPLRAERQLRSRKIARAGGAFAKSARSEAEWRARVSGVGDGHAATLIPACGRLRVGLSLPSRKI